MKKSFKISMALSAILASSILAVSATQNRAEAKAIVKQLLRLQEPRTMQFTIEFQRMVHQVNLLLPSILSMAKFNLNNMFLLRKEIFGTSLLTVVKLVGLAKNSLLETRFL